jgi:hypothetical protein
MSILITNTISSAKKQRAVNQAVRDAIGEREGSWRVFIAESPDRNAWNVIIRNPSGFHWAQHCIGSQCTPDHLGNTIQSRFSAAKALAK